ncbi:Alpha/Beta hydrolase protein [Zychaea mexicana]|uniref:Alpha/Beta hydrolase protein n=1 Tax=Zychaea mexicana TaxID=64656 RepID=UPI0022FEDA3C|nr:Alpha/Beta hydrolase protein [Zychaea mexicana]KAI9490418.1 Alpha/Beta hydrolase protein [Zychaea mexicana]
MFFLPTTVYLLLSYALIACLCQAVSLKSNNDIVVTSSTGSLTSKGDFAPKSFLSVTHPSFPQYLIRLTEPDAEICDPSVKQYSGYLDSVEDDKHFFFWFFESRNDPATDPIVLWLNGGPGCSSMTGLFLELGPCQLNEFGNETYYNPYSWNNNASLIFLDQPINVGYSYGSGNVSDSVTAAQDVYAFLQLFFERFPEYNGLDFHIAGESYAGHYIPAIATEIVDGNNLAAAETTHVNLKSLLIGNGLTDPSVQYGYYGDMACNNTYYPVLEQSACDKMEQAYPECKKLIEMCYEDPVPRTCIPASRICNEALLEPYYALSGRNPYDVRKTCASVDDNLCDDKLGLLQTYLNRADIKHKVGSSVDSYFNCNLEVNYLFQRAGDWMRPYVNNIPRLLDQDNVSILIYAGDADFICNWIGNKAWTLELEWSDREAWRQAEDVEWNQVGQIRSSPDGRFAFLRVYGAGHMVPEDQPQNSLAFFNGWIHGGLL